ncbi:MAG TPA: alcohol dehydrogenase catalytic domain-containing protein [Terriglobia bacterium]|nr:alcohol dehydrogenase catalytic domain-containing protein [Terriglobia bacterium]
MKALVYTGVRRLELQDWPDPELGPGEALVRVGGVGVCGSDVHGWLGHSRGRVPPLVLGHEMAGVVERVEDGGTAVKAGDRVAVYPLVGCGECSYCAAGRECLCRRKKLLGMHVPGGFAEYLKAPVKNLYPIHERMTLAKGAVVEPLANALHFVRAARADRGACAILGAGPIGLLILEVTRQMSLAPDGRIAVVEVNANRSAIARDHGASLVVNPKEPDALDRLDEFFDEDGCAVVFDAAGLSATRQMALGLVKSGGVVVLAGLSEAETAIDFIEVIRREVRLAGVYAYGREEFQLAVEWMAEGRANLDGLISEARLAEGQAVFEDLARPDSQRVKVILKP